MATDYKTKYLDIRSKLIESTDVAYRLGMEEGLVKGQQQAQEQMMAQQQAQQEAMMQGGGMPGEEGGEGMPPGAEGGGMPGEEGGEMPPEAMGGEEEQSELDSHIQQLEEMVSKGEKPSITSMRGVVKDLSNFRKNQKDQWAKKTEKTSSAQKELVDGMLKKWESESKKTEENLEDLINQHVKTED